MSSMECPAEEGAPTLRGELKRGVNLFNLKFGAVAAVLLGAGLGAALGSRQYALGVTIGLFVALTLLHTLAHGCMGWVFERGLKLHCQQDYRRAARWLAMAAQPGMDHYDPNGVALEALRDCRQRLQV